MLSKCTLNNALLKEYIKSTWDRGFKLLSDQSKECKFGICYFSAKHAHPSLNNKSKWLPWKHVNLYKWINMSTLWLLYKWINMSTLWLLLQWTSIQASYFSIKKTSSASHRNVTCSRHELSNNKCPPGVKQPSLRNYSKAKELS